MISRFEWLYKTFFKDCNSILDAGCGFGELCQLNPKKIIGIDNDKNNIKICRKKGLNVRFASLEKRLPFDDNTFSGINCSEVLEHLFYPLNTMKEFYRILKHKGRLVISVPCYKYYRAYHFSHHVFFRKCDVETIAKMSGFEIERIFEIRGFRFIQLFGEKIGFFIARLLPRLGIHGVVYLVAKKK